MVLCVTIRESINIYKNSYFEEPIKKKEAVSKVIKTGFCHSDPAHAGEESLIINELDISTLACHEHFGKLSTGAVEGLNMTNKFTFETVAFKLLSIKRQGFYSLYAATELLFLLVSRLQLFSPVSLGFIIMLIGTVCTFVLVRLIRLIILWVYLFITHLF